MGRVAARRVITGVQDVASVGHWPKRQLIGDAVRLEDGWPVVKLPVAAPLVTRLHPRPAREETAGRIDVRPELLSDRDVTAGPAHAARVQSLIGSRPASFRSIQAGLR